MSFLEISEDRARGTLTLSVRVQPRASKDEIAGALGGALKIRLCAPAIENRANEALVEFLSDLLKTPKSAVRIQSGEHGWRFGASPGSRFWISFAKKRSRRL